MVRWSCKVRYLLGTEYFGALRAALRPQLLSFSTSPLYIRFSSPHVVPRSFSAPSSALPRPQRSRRPKFFASLLLLIYKLLALQPCDVHMRACLLATLAFTVSSVWTCETNGSSAVCTSFTNAPDVANLTVTDDCKLPSSLLNISTLTLRCPISAIPYFSLRVFPRLDRLILTECNISSFPWQSLALANKKMFIDLTNCPLSCSCDNAWLPRKLPDFFPLPSPKASLNCDFSQCPITRLAITTRTSNGSLGSPFSIKTSVTPPTDSSSLPVPLPFYGWFADWPGIDPRGEESVNSSSISLHIDSLEKDHLGRIVVRCWHCPDPAFVTSEVGWPVVVMSLRCHGSLVWSRRWYWYGVALCSLSSFTLLSIHFSRKAPQISPTRAAYFLISIYRWAKSLCINHKIEANRRCRAVVVRHTLTSTCSLWLWEQVEW